MNSKDISTAAAAAKAAVQKFLVDPWAIPMDVTAAELADVIVVVRAEHKLHDEARQDAKAPHLEAARQIDVEYNAAGLAQLKLDLTKLTMRLTDYLVSKYDGVASAFERQRRAQIDNLTGDIERHLAAGDEAMAEAAAADIAKLEAMLPEPPTLRGKHSSTHGRRTAEFAVTDWRLVPTEFLRLDEKKLKAFVEDGSAVVPGVTITHSVTAVTR